ncbi:hypothetical protein HK098_008278 [Nowakowskiella sp. JEL0407]|nr:hypothetical protein HK098_008278 [Nowakowskiella sp. JEL0407]
MTFEVRVVSDDSHAPASSSAQASTAEQLLRFRKSPSTSTSLVQKVIHKTPNFNDSPDSPESPVPIPSYGSTVTLLNKESSSILPLPATKLQNELRESVPSHSEPQNDALSSRSQPQSLTINFKDLPNWRQDNMYILTGYWRITDSYLGCFKSLFHIHNETGNIYTHLIGAIGFLTLLFVSFKYFIPVFESTDPTDVVVVSVFISGAVVCLSLSSLFHLFQSHSMKIATAWNKADYIGIVVLIVSSFVPALYYGFMCDWVYKTVYIAFISFFGTVIIVFSLSKYFTYYRVLRTCMFLGMGLSSILPVGHAVAAYGYNFMQYAMSLDYLILMGVLYVCGTLIYAFRIPEKWYPGKFDLVFHSHQIFHVFVVAAALTHYYGVLRAYKFWHVSELNVCPQDLLGLFQESLKTGKFSKYL